MARLRTRSTAISKGIAIHLASGLSDTEGAGCTYEDWCSDVVGNRNGANPLDLEHSTNLKWTVSGLAAGWWDCKEFAVSTSIPGTSAPGVAIPSDDEIMTHALAVTNPNTPRVDIPQFVIELKDIPRAVKLWGDTILNSGRRFLSKSGDLRDLPRKVAEHYLDYRFNIVPTLRDLGGLLDFQNSVERKQRQLTNLGKVGHSSGAATGYEDMSYSSEFDDYATPLYQESRHVISRYRTYRKKWASTIWKPTVDLTSYTDDDYREKAIELAYGLNFSFSQVWELMPWSWLIDWFSNVGDVVASNRNNIPVTHGGSCVMMRTTVSREILGTTVGGSSTLRVRPPHSNLESKIRVVIGDDSPRLAFSLPFLDGGQLSILGALAVVRR